MEKPLLTAWMGLILGGTELLGFPGAEQFVLARLLKSQIWHPPAGSVALWVEGSEQEQRPLPNFLSRRKLSPTSCPDARHFSFSP